MIDDTIEEAADAASLLAAQARRLRQVSLLLGGADHVALADDRDDIIRSLSYLVGRVYGGKDDAELWLLFTAMSGAFPSDVDIERAIRFRDENSQDTFFDWMIPATATAAVWGGSASMDMMIVSDRPVVDVTACARYDRHTGIQRVERETIPLWNRHHAIELVAWTRRASAYRSLTTRERDRVLNWGGPRSPEIDGETALFTVPWRTTIVLPEVTDKRQSSRLRAIAKHSGSRIAAIAYDVIPLTSPELLPSDHGSDFVEYLGMMQYASVVAGISQSATEEFHGYFESAGIPETAYLRVEACELPTAVPDSVRLSGESVVREIPVVLCVGSHEPRKNHVAVLFAAERLWREGHRFELWFFGGGGWGTDFDVQAEALRKRGRKVLLKKGVSDAVLWEAYRDARFTVFPSLHEGFGLPAAESLSFGTPVITTDYGSTREIAERGGSIMVDPRNDAQIHDAMKLLLTDDVEHRRLSEEALAIPVRTWGEYADDLWKLMIVESVVHHG